MTPELRKESSELQLHKLGIRTNVQLHVIESDEEIQLRSTHEVANRLISLWAVSTANAHQNHNQVLSYLMQHQLDRGLSKEELEYLQARHRPIKTQFQHCHHALVFLAWCAGLIEKIHLPSRPINIEALLDLFPTTLFEADPLTKITEKIKFRRKDTIMDWADLLYRLHWAIRHAALTGKPSPGNINPDLVCVWHHAVNWMCHYDDEDNWDQVSTETTA